jgi:carbon-monoxide dehydrogenase large subunit
MDYALPRADDLPAFEITHQPTRCTTNPLGVKGCGEAGAIAGYPAVANAIADALSHMGDAGNINLTGAASPHRLWRLLR